MFPTAPRVFCEMCLTENQVMLYCWKIIASGTLAVITMTLVCIKLVTISVITKMWAVNMKCLVIASRTYICCQRVGSLWMFSWMSCFHLTVVYCCEVEETLIEAKLTPSFKLISFFTEVGVKKRTKPQVQRKVALKKWDTALKKHSYAPFLRSDIERYVFWGLGLGTVMRGV